jgi:hypothetical protein
MAKHNFSSIDGNEEKDEKKKSLVDSGSDTLWIYL